MPVKSSLRHAATACAIGAAISTLFSISLSQILLGAGVLLLLLSREPLRLPPILIPLTLFFAGTFLAIAFSSDPTAALPQIRKLYVFLGLVLFGTAIRTPRHARWIAFAWTAAATASALLAFQQFYERWVRGGPDFYSAYVSDRITGFMSHWMTFSGMQLIALLFAVSLLLFGKLPKRTQIALALASLCILTSIVLSLTRGVWLATAASGLYLLWSWKRWTVAVLPIAALLLFFAGPQVVRARISSFTRPHGELDSNQHRVVTFRTGVAMVEAHPWFGLGPEVVGKRFLEYVPADIPKPLPRGWYGHLHNIYLQYSAERGIPTMLALLAVFVLSLIRWRAALKTNSDKWLLHACIASIIAILVVGTVEHNLGDSEVLLMTLCVLCLGYL